MDEQQLLEELRVARETGDRAIECKALGTLTEYLNLAIELGDRWSEAVALYYLGFTQQAIEEPWLAVKSFALAYRWFRGLGLEEFAAIACRQKYWRRLMKIFKGGL